MADKEYIERGELLHQMRLQANRSSLGEFSPPHLSYGEMLTLVHEAPAENVVKVIVMCKDCKDFAPHGNGKAGSCKNEKCRGIRYATDFCSYGKPKE